MVPILTYPDVRAAVERLSAAFGFVEHTRIAESFEQACAHLAGVIEPPVDRSYGECDSRSKTLLAFSRRRSLPPAAVLIRPVDHVVWVGRDPAGAD